MAGRATLLVRTVDEILGTHTAVAMVSAAFRSSARWSATARVSVSLGGVGQRS
jgi:hypothetical protein